MLLIKEDETRGKERSEVRTSIPSRVFKPHSRTMKLLHQEVQCGRIPEPWYLWWVFWLAEISLTYRFPLCPSPSRSMWEVHDADPNYRQRSAIRLTDWVSPLVLPSSWRDQSLLSQNLWKLQNRLSLLWAMLTGCRAESCFIWVCIKSRFIPLRPSKLFTIMNRTTTSINSAAMKVEVHQSLAT